MYVNARHNNWDDAIDFVIFAYNSSKQESTGLSPFFILYGREPYLPIDVALGNDPDPFSGASNLVAYAQDLVSRLPVMREMVKRRLLMAQENNEDVTIRFGEISSSRSGTRCLFSNL